MWLKLNLVKSNNNLFLLSTRKNTNKLFTAKP